MPEADEPRNDDVPASEDSLEICLIEIEPGWAVVLADADPEGIDLIPFGMLADHERRNLSDEIAVASGVGHLATLGVQSMMSVRGLVRLAPETMKALNTARPMVKEGWNLGTLVAQNGKFAHSVRWAPAAGVKATTTLAMLGPAATMLALQVQVASISRRVDENIELTRDVLRALHEDQWATLVGLHETTLRALREAQAVGAVNDHIYSAISTREADLRKQRSLFLSLVLGHVAALKTGADGRRNYLQKNVEQIVADSHGMLMAEGSWFRAQILRAAHVSRDSSDAEENKRLLEALISETKREHTKAMEEIASLLSGLERQCRLMVELPAQRVLPFGSKRQSMRDAVLMAEALAQQVAQLRNTIHAQPPALEPPIKVFNDPVPADLLRILRWAMPENEELVAIADVNRDRFVADNAYLGVTGDGFFISSQAVIRKQGLIEQYYQLADLRYVRFTERDRQGPVLDLITRDENIRVTFDSWASQEGGLSTARLLADLFSSAMNLPAEEVRAHPLIGEGCLERQAISATP